MASLVKDKHSQVVLVEDKLSTRILTLNRPKQFNALDHQLISRLSELFITYERDPSVKLLILKGNGRAFCAGGDLAAMTSYIWDGTWRLGAKVTWNLYILNYVVATYTKPQISILNGIVMGGGAGISIHGRFRVTTENSVFAMPEAAVGLFPDVGASFFLSRLPGFFGEYVGLTGTRLDGAEMLLCGLATHFVPSAKLPSLEEALCKVDSSDQATISTIIDKYSQQPHLKQGNSYHRLDVIDRCFSLVTVEEILSALEREATTIADNWIFSTIRQLKNASPISLKISLRSIREGRMQGVGQCLVREYRMVCHVLRGTVTADLAEGCRALLFAKDMNPKWEPSKLELIDETMVQQYFSKVDEDGWEELKLPSRLNLPGYSIAKL